MDCCRQCQGIESVFNDRMAADELRDFLKKGAPRETTLLVEAIQSLGTKGLSLLDIGGGVGAIQYALLEAGAASAVDVDASSAYIRAAKQETERRGLTDRIQHTHGNFVELDPELEQADIVTLDRVICCYHDMESLVGLSSGKARKFYGIVYPQDWWWIRIAFRVISLFSPLFTHGYRAFIHRTQAVESIIAENGLKRVYYRGSGVWQIAVFAR